MRRISKARALFATVAVGIISVIAISVSLTRPANAVVADVVQKWMLAMHYNCVRDYAASPINPDGTEKIEDLMYPGSDADRMTEPLPSLDYFTEKISSEGGYLTCRQVLKGDGIIIDDISGIFKLMGVNNSTTWRDISGAAGVAEKLGYSSEEGGIKITIDEMRYDENGGGDGSRFEGSDLLTVTESNGRLDYGINYFFSTAAIYKDVQLELNDSKTQLTITFDPMRNIFDGCSITVGDEVSRTADLSRDNIFATINSIQTAINEINNTRFVESCENREYTGDGYRVSGLNTYTLRLRANTAGSEYALLPDRSAAAAQSINRLTNGGSIESSVKMSDEEKYNMYTYYITHAKNYDASKLDCHNNGGREVFLKVGGQWTKFYLNEHVGDWESYVVLNDDGTFGSTGIEGIIYWLRAYMGDAEFREVGDNESCPTPDVGEQITQTTVDPENSCFSNANSLGWIVCPIITATGNAISTLYDSIIQPLLQIKASALDRQSTAYQAWQYFQSIANIIFVILFLVVIMSQITGVGIDNLGIKRILPKLIISAVLVNLSYIICMLLVDVSNIAGSGIYSFFNGLSVSPGTSAYSGQTAVNTLLSGLGLGAGGAVLFATAPFWGAAAIPAILLGLISILISIITMFVLLGVYQAGVVIAVVVSPIAFVLYMLPNTKSIFDRWRKLFQSLLLLYPLCGLMMGGGAFAGRVIQGVSDGFWMSLLGALLSVIPFFFIPAILKSSMAAMGNIGAKISGLGKAASGRATGAIAKSEPFKEWQTNRAAGRGLNGEKTLLGRRRDKLAKKDSIIGRAAKRAAVRGESSYQKLLDEKEFSPDELATEHENKRFDRRVKVIEANNVKSGTSSKTGGLKEDQFQAGAAFESGTLASQLYNANTMEEQYAAVNQLMAQKKPGFEALRQVMQRMSEDGRMSDLTAISKAAKANPGFAGLKDKSPSTFDFVNDVGSGRVVAGETLDSRIGNTNFGSMKPEEFSKISSEEAGRYASALESGALSEQQGQQLRTLVTSTVSNERLFSQASDNTKKEYRAILEKTGGVPQAYADKLKIASVSPNGDAVEDQSFNIRGNSGNYPPGYDGGH